MPTRRACPGRGYGCGWSWYLSTRELFSSRLLILWTVSRSDQLLAVVVVHLDGVNRAGPGRELRVEFGVRRYLPLEDARLDRLAPREVGLAVTLVLLEGVPLGDALEHPDAGVAVEPDSHTLFGQKRSKA